MSKEEELKDEVTSTNIVIAVNRYELVETEKAWKTTLESYRDVPCETLEDEDMWSDAVAHAQAEFKRIDGDRSEIALPMDRELKSVNKWFRAPLNALEEFKKLGLGKLAACRQLRDDRERELRLAASTAADEGDSEAAYDALALIPDTVKVSGTSVRYVWEVELVDESQVPERFKSFDEKKVLTHLKQLTQGSNVAIPGLNIRYVPKVQPTGRK